MAPEQQITAKFIGDGALVVSGGSAPWWVQYLDDPLATALAIGAGVLIVLRALTMLKELRKP